MGGYPQQAILENGDKGGFKKLVNRALFTLLAKYAFLFLIQTKSYVVIALSVITHLSLRFYLAALSIVHIFLHSLGQNRILRKI